MEQCKAQQIVEKTGLQPWRRVLLGEVVGTKQRGVQGGNKDGAKQVSRRSHTSNWRPRVYLVLQANVKNIWTQSSFAGVEQRRRLLRGLDILTIKWAIGDLPEECETIR